VYQLVATDIADDFPPPRTVSGGRAAFPAFATSFVGRSAEVADLSGRLVDPGTRILTLLGPGGIGKTRLATETAGHVSAEFPGGAAFADLVQIAEPEGIPMAIAQAIGVHPEGTASVIDIVIAEISDPTLLVLDTFDHVIGGSRTIADLIARCSALTLLITSRTPLRIQGEAIHQMLPLSVESGNGAVPAAVGLFVDRAAEHGVDIDPDGPEGDAVRSIVQRVDGLPLAIELVAARVRLLSVTELDHKLGQSLAVVGGGAADLPERQQTIESTIDWSVNTLSPDQRMLFQRLSVFPAGATLEEIESVVAAGLDGDALDLVSALVDNSLVSVITDLPGGTRFRQLTVLREYAAQRLLESGDSEPTRSRLVDHYLTAAEAIGRSDEQGIGLREAQAEHSNLASAMEWSLGAGRSDDMVRVVYNLWPVWFNGDRAGEAAAWLHRVDQDPVSPELDWLHGMFAFQTGDYVESADRFERALTGFEANEDPYGIALSRVFVGALSDPVEGEAMLADAHAYFRAENQHLGQFLALLFTSVKVVEADDLPRALELRRQLLEDARALGYDEVVAWSHWNLANALMGLGRIDEAAEENRIAFETFAALRYHEGISSASENVAIFAASNEQWEPAVLIHGACEAIWDRLGVRGWWEIVPHIANAMSAARASLGDGEYQRLEAQGRTLAVDDLVELAQATMSS